MVHHEEEEEEVPAIEVETAPLAAAVDLDTMTITRRRRSRLAVEDLLRAAEDTQESAIIATAAVLLYLLSLLGAHPWDLAAALVAVRTAGMTTILPLIREVVAIGATTERVSLPDHPAAGMLRLDGMVLLLEEVVATFPAVLAEPRTLREVPKVARLPPAPQPVPHRRRPRRHLRLPVVRLEEASSNRHRATNANGGRRRRRRRLLLLPLPDLVNLPLRIDAAGPTAIEYTAAAAAITTLLPRLLL